MNMIHISEEFTRRELQKKSGRSGQVQEQEGVADKPFLIISPVRAFDFVVAVRLA